MQIDADEVKAAADIVNVVTSLSGVDLRSKGPRDLVGCCPFDDHEDVSPSFTITPDKGLWKCFGCGRGGNVFQFLQQYEGLSFRQSIIRVMQIEGIPVDMYKPSEPPATQSKVVATYAYCDEQGNVVMWVDRKEPGQHGKKDFYARHKGPDGKMIYNKEGCRPVLYNLPDVLAEQKLVFVVEGEKDADTLTSLGFTATTNQGGSGAPWLTEYTESLRHIETIVIIADADEPGRRHATKVRDALTRDGVAVIEMPSPAKDATEYLATHSKEDFDAYVAKCLRAIEGEDPFKSPLQIMEEFPGGLEAFANPSELAKGVPSPWPQFNRMTGGFHAGQLILIAARPSVGKSALAAQIAKFAAQNCDVPFLSLEMKGSDLLQRYVAELAQIDFQHYLHEQQTTDEIKRVTIALGALADLQIGISEE